MKHATETQLITVHDKHSEPNFDLNNEPSDVSNISIHIYIAERHIDLCQEDVLSLFYAPALEMGPMPGAAEVQL